MPVDDWGPIIKTNMQTVHTASQAAAEIPTAGVVYGYNQWPLKLLSFPSTLIGTQGGGQVYGEGSPAVAMHNVKIWVYFSLGLSLAEAQKMSWPFVERVRNMFAQDMNLGGTCKTFLPPPLPALFYEGPGVLEYAGTPHAGLMFHYDLKDVETGTFTVQA